MGDRIIYMAKARRRTTSFVLARRRRVFFLIFSAVFLFISSAVYVLQRKEFVLVDIEVIGLEKIARSEIEDKLFKQVEGNYAFLIPKGSWFVVSEDELEKTLADSFPRIERVSVSREFPNRIRVIISEREPWAIFCEVVVAEASVGGTGSETSQEGEQCVYIDQKGVVIEKAPRSQGFLITKIEVLVGSPIEFSAGGVVLDSLLMEKIAAWRDRIKDVVGSDVAVFRIGETISGEVHIVLQGGLRLVVLQSADIEVTLSTLDRILKEVGDKRPKLDYVDLRFGSKVFLKYRK